MLSFINKKKGSLKAREEGEAGKEAIVAKGEGFWEQGKRGEEKRG